ncbi:molybdenum cofactor biosynthesis protein MoaE [Microlunatus speluncae]|uniref:molybdenum cofactor biosynthesis protein MoaE n=1 Tax=Microlunatus speluncae TaxID=2594267 RepID=UPI0012661A23|nr:molybdenum cofactor biosynthesis protein MoaE [Microlunatus speluncae]
MSAVRHVLISSSPLSVDRVLAAVANDRVGGIGLFIGTVRNVDEDRPVITLDYTAHPTAESTLREVAEQTTAGRSVITAAVEHRIGALAIGELAVVVAVGAEHRAEALEVCRDLIDRIKAEVPIWKEQEFADGDTAWVGLR